MTGRIVCLVPGSSGFTSIGALSYLEDVEQALALCRRQLDARIVRCETQPAASILRRSDALTARPHQHYPYPLPSKSTQRLLDQDLGFRATPAISDGIVPTLSQLHGQVLHVARADQLDLVGHYTLAGRSSGELAAVGRRFNAGRFRCNRGSRCRGDRAKRPPASVRLDTQPVQVVPVNRAVVSNSKSCLDSVSPQAVQDGPTWHCLQCPAFSYVPTSSACAST